MSEGSAVWVGVGNKPADGRSGSEGRGDAKSCGVADGGRAGYVIFVAGTCQAGDVAIGRIEPVSQPALRDGDVVPGDIETTVIFIHGGAFAITSMQLSDELVGTV